MRKILFCIAVLFVIILAGSSFKHNETSSELKIGSKMPVFKLNDNSLILGNDKSKYTLVTFWMSSDAESRMACAQYDRMISSDRKLSEKICFEGVNFDISKSLFEEIIACDNLNSSTQVYADLPNRKEMIKVYGLEKGFGSVLVSPKGEIIEFNPSKEDLIKLIVN